MSDSTSPELPPAEGPPSEQPQPRRPVADPKRRRDRVAQSALGDIMATSGVMIFLAIVLALLLGALLVALFNPYVRETLSYFFARPSDTFEAMWRATSSYFTSLFRGSIYDYQALTFARSIRPLMNTLTNATPLIFTGLAVGIGFRAGMFNIGANGQLIVGAIAAVYVGFAFTLPAGIHVLVAILAALLAGGIWGGIVGLMKAKVNANEVITTIMLNSIALYLLTYLLKTPTFIGEGGSPGISQQIKPSAAYPSLAGSIYSLHWGFILALLTAALMWWVLERSTFGFELKAVGANPKAARSAGMSITRVIIITMALSGALAGLAGTAPGLGTEKFLTVGIAANYGFDAITVALLGRSKPIGIVFAALLFGALNSGGSLMQAASGIPVDIVQVAQAVIVLLIAAPPLVRAIFRLPTPRDRRVLDNPVGVAPGGAV